MQANYIVWGSGLGGPKDDYFSSGGGHNSTGRGNFFLGGGLVSAM